MMTHTPMSGDNMRAVEELCQFFKWAGTPHNPAPYRVLAEDWYSGLLTIEEGQRIEESRQVWQHYRLEEI